MSTSRRSLAALMATPLIAAGLFACGEEGQSIGQGQCPVLPVYHWQYTDAGGWQQVTPSGAPLANADKNAIDQATNDQPPNGRCQTPAGTATTIGAPAPPGSGGAAGAAGAGGAKSTGGAGGAKSTGGAGGAKSTGGAGGAKGGAGGVKSQDAGKD
jgi:hypothetical protein